MTEPAASAAGKFRPLSVSAVSPCKLAHLVLRTPRYEEMCTFYVALLNAEVPFADKLTTFIRYDEEHHRLVLVNTPELKVPDRPFAGLAHFAFTYRSLEELLGTYRRLQQRGIVPSWCINHGFTSSIYYSDPDGNQVETQYDNMDTAGADAFMRSPYFHTNPIGVDFDPELLIERYERGDALAELIKQGSAPFPPGAMPVGPHARLHYDFRGAELPR
jgi:catechol 2,3-dioxygenase-like lactoylglutathione lyase family enzyme